MLDIEQNLVNFLLSWSEEEEKDAFS